MSHDAPAGDNSAEQAEREGPGFLGNFDSFLRVVALWLGGVLLAAMVVLTFTHVVRRYVFNDPIQGFVDMGQILLVLVVALTVAYSGRTGGQIAVELIDGMVSKTKLRMVEIFVRLVGFLMIAALTVQIALDGPKAEENGEFTGTIDISFEPFMYVLAFGLGLYAIVLLLEAVRLMKDKDIGQEQARLFGGDEHGTI